MAVRKRELTVEQWCHHEVEFADFIVKHPEQLYDLDRDSLEGIMGETMMAKSFLQCGMQVYEFDRDFAESILDESWTELLPEVIDYAPHYCFYLKLPFNELSEGCVICISEMDEVINIDQFDLGYAEGEAGVYRNPADGLGVVVNTGEKLLNVQGYAIPREFGMMFDDTVIGEYPNGLLANGVAYLCSKNADIAAVYSPSKERKRNKAKRRSQATWHEVGYRVGAELRNYMRAKSVGGEKTGRKVRPHMRRAHWHRFWTGPRDGERRLVLKWVAPVMVGVDIDSATLHKVR